MENYERDGNTRPPDLPLEKSVCRSGSKGKARAELRPSSVAPDPAESRGAPPAKRSLTAFMRPPKVPRHAGLPRGEHRGSRSPGEGKGNPLQYSCLENPMDPYPQMEPVSPALAGRQGSSLEPSSGVNAAFITQGNQVRRHSSS